MFKKFLKFSPVIFLMSCASLDEEACRTGDWEGIGYNDGTRGRYVSFFNEHREACGEYGIAPNKSLWLLGRAEGLKLYCTTDNAYNTGRRGKELNNVCQVEQLSDLKLANFYGLRYYEIEQELDALIEEQEEILLLLENPELSDEVRLLYLSRYTDLRETIFELKLELRKYDELP